MNRLLKVVLLSCCFVLCIGIAYSFAGEVDILVQKLVEKGVLTHGEAQQIITETKEEVRAELAAGKSPSVPTWVQNMKLGGDLRLRFEQSMPSGTSQDRHRGRIRLRLGLDTKINDQLKAGIRIATGTGEQTSTNQTFTGGFQGKAIYLDQAYLTYMPQFSFANISLTGGKMSNPFYATDLMWDGDVTPEGVAMQAELPLKGLGATLFSNIGTFFLYESSSSYDEPIIVAAQGGLKGKLLGRDYKTGVTYYDFANLKGNTVATIFPGKQVNTNTLTGTAYKYDFNIVDINAEYKPFEINLLGKTLPVTVFGNYLMNVADGIASDDDSGWTTGFKLGSAKKKGDWQFDYAYKVLQKDAMVGELVDSDFHGGGTNGRGNKFGLAYGLLDNTTLNLTYFNTWEEKGSKSHNDLVQVDVVSKF
jgi:hypothetical protein